MRCNICDGTEFGDMGSRKSVRCIRCNSLERTRLLWMHLERLPLGPGTRVLHIAPEKGLSDKLRSVCGKSYTPADFDPSAYSWADGCVRIDLCELDDWPSDRFDLILHSHVLEHTPCNIAYTLAHLHRMLAIGGSHVMVVPFMPGYFDETFEDIGDQERVRRFGQRDHVRRFGVKDLDRHLAKLIKMPAQTDATAYFPAEQLDRFNIPSSQRTGLSGSTVIKLGKDDIHFRCKEHRRQ